MTRRTVRGVSAGKPLMAELALLVEEDQDGGLAESTRPVCRPGAGVPALDKLVLS
jgi:hypothetical protein